MKGAVILVVASLLIGPILLAVLRGHRLEMGLDELDYVLGFAAWTNCFGVGLVLLAIPPAAVESFEIAIRALSVPCGSSSTLEAEACRHRAASVDQAPRKQPSKIWEFASAGHLNDAVDWNLPPIWHRGCLRC